MKRREFRDLLSGGTSDPARISSDRAQVTQYVQLNEGVCYIPPEMGLFEEMNHACGFYNC